MTFSLPSYSQDSEECQPTNGILISMIPSLTQKLPVQDANELLAKAPMTANHLSKERVLEKKHGSSPDCLYFLPALWCEWFIYRFNHSDSNMPKLSVERLKTEAPDH